MTASRRALPGVILLYHRIVTAASDPFGLCVAPETFQRQMEYVRRTCAPLTLPQFAAALSTRSLPNRAVAITFDDGYLDSLTTAAPILEGLELSATFFVTTGDLDRPHEFWWDALIRSAGFEEQAIRHVHERAVVAPVDERDEILRPWLQDGGEVNADCLDRPMLGTELARLAAMTGQQIGAHTVNHLYLPAQTSTVCRAEFVDCRRTLQQRLGGPVGAVAYPFGGVTPAISQMAAETGYEIGVTVDARAVTVDDNVLALPRVPINADVIDFPGYLERMFSSGAVPA